MSRAASAPSPFPILAQAPALEEGAGSGWLPQYRDRHLLWSASGVWTCTCWALCTVLVLYLMHLGVRAARTETASATGSSGSDSELKVRAQDLVLVSSLHFKPEISVESVFNLLNSSVWRLCRDY